MIPKSASSITVTRQKDGPDVVVSHHASGKPETVLVLDKKEVVALMEGLVEAVSAKLPLPAAWSGATKLAISGVPGAETQAAVAAAPHVAVPALGSPPPEHVLPPGSEPTPTTPPGPDEHKVTRVSDLTIGDGIALTGFNWYRVGDTERVIRRGKVVAVGRGAAAVQVDAVKGYDAECVTITDDAYDACKNWVRPSLDGALL